MRSERSVENNHDAHHDEQSASHEHAVRIAKVKAMHEVGIDPWPPARPVNTTARDILDEFAAGKQKDHPYEITGRLITIRHHGKTVFATLQDATAQIQIYIRKDLIGEDSFKFWCDFIDSGDIVWCTGTAFATKTGETTLQVTAFELQSKCLFPLPEKFHGLTDIEQRYRQRYLDLMCNKENRRRFIQRSHIIRSIRQFLENHDYVEVETPMLHPIPGGAAARPFQTHHNTLDTTLYLRIAPELYLKRLIIGGFDRVYEINRNFRNEGISTRHNPEFTMLEFYTAYKTLDYAIDIVERMLRALAQEIHASASLPFGEQVIDFAQPFARLTMKEAVMKYLPCLGQDLDEDRIDHTLATHGVEVSSAASWGMKLYRLFEEKIEKQLIQPTFIIEFPIEVSPLSKRNETNRNVANRFELFIAGMELSNAFDELNNPFDQAQRFEEQARARSAGDIEAHYFDADYVHALEYGLPPTVGVGIGIDRLVMLLTDAPSIKEVILFPTLRQKHHTL